MRELERVVLLNITDTKWREHLYEMDYLQEGIHLRAYAQRDPLTEYRREAFDMFEALTQSIREDFVKYIYRVELVRQEQQAAAPRLQRVQENKEAVARAPAAPGRRPRRDEGMGRPRRRGDAAGGVGQGAAQRPLSVRERPQVQEVPRRRRLRDGQTGRVSSTAGFSGPQMSSSRASVNPIAR